MLKVDDTLENKFPRARLENQGGNCVWDIAPRRGAAFSGYRFSLYPPSISLSLSLFLVQLRRINIALVRASWKWKRWGWQLREFLFPIITALSLRFAQIRGYCTAEVILWSLLTMPTYWKRDAPPSNARIAKISTRYLFIRKTNAISLYSREKRPRLFFIRETYVTSLYIFDTKRIRDEISKMKTKTVQRMAILHTT